MPVKFFVLLLALQTMLLAAVIDVGSSSFNQPKSVGPTLQNGTDGSLKYVTAKGDPVTK